VVERMVALSRQNPRYGYRRVWALLGREGWEVNKKRVQRLWREAGLKVPASSRERKRRRPLGASENGCTRRCAEHVDHVWSYDFAMDATEDGRRLKIMPIVDEYSRECLALEAERSITAKDVIATLDRLFNERGEPAYIRSDNGPEFIAKAIKHWLATSGVETLYIEPGAPWENAYSETFISRLRDELLNIIPIVDDQRGVIAGAASPWFLLRGDEDVTGRRTVRLRPYVDGGWAKLRTSTEGPTVAPPAWVRR
jgi:putative transposase